MNQNIKRILELDIPLGEKESKKPGMVCQIWEDGEVTLQHGGNLLWRRSLHMISFPLEGVDISSMLPHKVEDHSYAFLSGMDIAKEIRGYMTE